jgi:hypothetical protein
VRPGLQRNAPIVTTLTAAGLAGAVASAATIAGYAIDSDLSQADSARAPVTIVRCLITGVAFAVIAVALPGLLAVTRLPRRSLAFACTFTAIPAWAFGTILPRVAANVSAAKFDDLGHADLLLALLSAPTQALTLVGFIALAVPGWRRPAFSRGAAVVFMLAAVAGAITGERPIVGVLAGAATAGAARTTKATHEN